MSEIEATINRISSYEGVDRILIIKSVETEDSINSIIMRSMINNNKPELKTEKEKMKENLFAKAIPQLGREAKSLIRQLDSKNDLTFLELEPLLMRYLLHLIKLIIYAFCKICQKIKYKKFFIYLN